mgnify:CR=1 FL=1
METEEKTNQLQDTKLSKASELPHRLFMYSAFQKLIEASLQSSEATDFSGLLQQTIEETALQTLMEEMNNNECFTVAEA